MKFFFGLNILSVSLLSISSLLWAESDKPAEVSLLKDLQNIEAFQARYQQSIQKEEGKAQQQSRGVFYFGKQKRFQSVEEFPERSALVSNGSKLWQIDYDLEQVSINYLENYLAGSPLSLLLDSNEKALAQFEVKKVENSKRQQVLYKLRAVDQQSPIVAIRIGFKQKQLSYIEMDESRGNRVRVTFSELETLKSDSVFSPTIPEGFDVVDETLTNANE